MKDGQRGEIKTVLRRCWRFRSGAKKKAVTSLPMTHLILIRRKWFVHALSIATRPVTLNRAALPTNNDLHSSTSSIITIIIILYVPWIMLVASSDLLIIKRETTRLFLVPSPLPVWWCAAWSFLPPLLIRDCQRHVKSGWEGSPPVLC